MKIHDALIYELIKPEKSEPYKATGGIVDIVGTSNIRYTLESSFTYHEIPEQAVAVTMTPDVVVTKLNLTLEEKETDRRNVAIELETDEDFDFGNSLRQIKKYQNKFNDVRVIIPIEYEKFVPLYKNEGFRVYFWKAIRKYQCLRCKNETEIEGPFEPKCKKCNKYSKHRLIGLKDAKFDEFS